jgi:hypothetical protein
VAAVYYDDADENSMPTSESVIDPSRLLPCSGDPLEQLVPLEAMSASPQGTLTTIEMRINFTQSGNVDSGFENRWTINEKAYHADLSRALLSEAQKGTLNMDDELM